jgi:hypothetical protein
MDNEKFVFTLHSLPGRDGTVKSNPYQVELLGIRKVLTRCHVGLPCSCCYESRNSPADNIYYQNGKRSVHFCGNCRAMICRECAWNIKQYRGEQELGCRWCGEVLRLDTCLLSNEQETDPSFQCYDLAHQNIKGILTQWCHSMHRTYEVHDLSKIFWADMVDLIGWRFFARLDFLLEHQHPNQFRLLVSMMLKNAFPRFRQEVLQSYSRFYQMPGDMCFIYRQSRKSAIIHHFSFMIARRLTANNRTCASYMHLIRYLLAKFAQRLAYGLAICDLTEDLTASCIDMSDC